MNWTRMMKLNRSICLLLVVSLVLIFFSCAPKKVAVSEPGETVPGETLFNQAEELFAEQSYAKALDYYRRYISEYPKGPAAALALLRIGYIDIERMEYSAARESFNRLLSEYPDSSFIGDARIGILSAHYYEGNYSQVIEQSSIDLEELKTAEYISRIYTVLGDTYIALEAPGDAVYFYVMAHKESQEKDSDILTEKLKMAINLLDTPAVLSLLEQSQEEMPRGYLLYQLGVNYSMAGEYEEALIALSEFVKDYPENEYAEDAAFLIEDLEGKTFYHKTTIGCLLPLSGRYRIYGNRALKGIEFAMARLMSDQEGQPIELIIKDTGSNPERVVSATEELVQDRVAAIIGPLVNAADAAQIAQENRIPIITITQKEDITDIGDYVFRNFLTPEMQVKAIVSYAAAVLGVSDFAVLYPEERYGRTFMNLFWDEVIDNGGRVVGVESYDPSQTDFAPSIKKLVGLYYDVPKDLREIVWPPQEEEDEPIKPSGEIETETETDEEKVEEEWEPEAIVDFEAIFIPDAPNKTGLIVPQLAYFDIDQVYLLGTNLWHSPKLIEMAYEYVQGAILSDGFFSGGRATHVRRFVNSFETTYGEKPGVIEATTYDSAAILFGIVTNPDIVSRSSIKQSLLSLTDFPGVTGSTSFDETGEAQKQLTMLQIDGNRFVELD
jgi:ABC-type branched-subunit amino acid transport system substrate-binding protein